MDHLMEKRMTIDENTLYQTTTLTKATSFVEAPPTQSQIGKDHITSLMNLIKQQKKHTIKIKQ